WQEDGRAVVSVAGRCHRLSPRLGPWVEDPGIDAPPAALPGVENLAVRQQKHLWIEGWGERCRDWAAPSSSGILQVINLDGVVGAAAQAEPGERHDTPIAESDGTRVPASIYHALRLHEALSSRIKNGGAVIASERVILGAADDQGPPIGQSGCSTAENVVFHVLHCDAALGRACRVPDGVAVALSARRIILGIVLGPRDDQHFSGVE